MTRKMRQHAALVTLLAFSGLAVLPPRAFADDGTPQPATQPTQPTAEPAGSAAADPAPTAGRAATSDEGAPGTLLAQNYPPAPPPPGYYPPPQPPPPAYYPPPGYYPTRPPRTVLGYEERPRWGLFAAGLSTFLGAYMPTLFVGVSAGESRLAVPLLGPMLLWDSSAPEFNSLLLLDTLVQVGGMAMLIAGLAAKKRVPVYQNVAIVPAASPQMAGLAAIGRF